MGPFITMRIDMDNRPNIIFIMTDQQRIDTINATGNRHMITPNMDELVNRGTTFNHAYCPGATCVASRAATFTGMYPHNNGVYSFDNWSHHHNFVKELNSSGYHCVNLGKMHVMPLYDSAGFHERRVVENKSSQFKDYNKPEDEWGNFLSAQGIGRPNNRHITHENWDETRNAVEWEYEERLHSDNYVGDISVEWLKKWNQSKPLFLEIGFPGPHEPYDPPKKYIDMYDGADIPEPLYREGELREKPIQQLTLRNYFRDVKHGEARINIEDASIDELLRMRKHYYANVTLIDEKIGKIVETLKTTGMLDNTILVLTSDHGENLGDHKLSYKWLMYDSIVRVPLVIRDFRKENNTVERSDEFVNLLDLAPTILEYAGIKVPDYFDGNSLTPILEDREDPADREYVFCEDNYLMMIRSKEYKLVYYIDQEYGEFYNLTVDAGELNNLFDDPEYRELVFEYKSKLLGFISKTSYFNGKYRCDRAREYSVRWPENDYYGAYLQGSKERDG